MNIADEVDDKSQRFVTLLLRHCRTPKNLFFANDGVHDVLAILPVATPVKCRCIKWNVHIVPWCRFGALSPNLICPVRDFGIRHVCVTKQIPNR